MRVKTICKTNENTPTQTEHASHMWIRRMKSVAYSVERKDYFL